MGLAAQRDFEQKSKGSERFSRHFSRECRDGNVEYRRTGNFRPDNRIIWIILPRESGSEGVWLRSTCPAIASLATVDDRGGQRLQRFNDFTGLNDLRSYRGAGMKGLLLKAGKQRFLSERFEKGVCNMVSTSKQKELLKKELVSCLAEDTEIRRIVVFGSFLTSPVPADMDVAVFQDSNEAYLPLAMKYRRQTRAVARRIPLDIIPLRCDVSGSSFLKEIEFGEVLYER